MNIHGTIFVRKGDWPRRVKITVYLNRDSKTGPRTSGDVKIVARKDNDPKTSQNLGMNNSELTVKVVNGKWENQSPWDYKYWADKGFNTLVAQYTDPDGEHHEWFWSSVPVQGNQGKPVPTSISKLHCTSIVDHRNPELMCYSITFTILDQFGKPIAGKVSSIFDGAINEVESKPDRPGVCFDTALVEGYNKEMRYAILLPTGEPQIEIFRGPTKSVPSKLIARIVMTKSEPGKYVYTVALLVLDNKDKEIDPGGDLNGRWTCGKQSEMVTLTNGSATVDVTVEEGQEKIPFTAFLSGPFLTLDQPMTLDGPVKKPDAQTVDVSQRFKVGVEGETVCVRGFRSVIPLDTFDKSGKPYASKVEAAVVQGSAIDFLNARNNVVLAEKACYCEITTDPDGSYRLMVDFKGKTHVTVELRHSDSNQRRRIKFVYTQH